MPDGGPWPLYASSSGIQKRIFSPSTITCTPSVQPGITPFSGNVAGSPRCHRAVEHLPVGGPARVVHLDLAVGRRLARAVPGFSTLYESPLFVFFASDGGAATSGGAVGGAVNESSSTSNTSMPCGSRVPLVGELLGDPEAALFAGDHQLHAFGPARESPGRAGTGRLAARHRAVEHPPVGGPARVVHGDRSVLPGDPCPCPP